MLDCHFSPASHRCSLSICIHASFQSISINYHGHSEKINAFHLSQISAFSVTVLTFPSSSARSGQFKLKMHDEGESILVVVRVKGSVISVTKIFLKGYSISNSNFITVDHKQSDQH